MVALATCDVVEPLPFICIPDATAEGSLAYHRHEDRTFGVARGQFGAVSPAVAAAPAQTAAAAAPDGAATAAAGPSGSRAGSAAPSGAAAAAAAASAAAPSGVEELPEPTGPPGTFRPARMSAAAAAMRCVCRAWCELLGEGVRRLVVPPPQASATLWPSHFSHVSHLALGGCDDVAVVLRPPPAFQRPDEDEKEEEQEQEEGDVVVQEEGRQRQVAGQAEGQTAGGHKRKARGVDGSMAHASPGAGASGSKAAAGAAEPPSRRRSARVATQVSAAPRPPGSGASGSAPGSAPATAAASGQRGGKRGHSISSRGGAAAAGAAAPAAPAAAAASPPPAAAPPPTALLTVPTGRTLAPLRHLRNLQVSDSKPHLDLAASAGPALEELVVIARRPVLGSIDRGRWHPAAGSGGGGGGSSGGSEAGDTDSEDEEEEEQSTGGEEDDHSGGDSEDSFDDSGVDYYKLLKVPPGGLLTLAAVRAARNQLRLVQKAQKGGGGKKKNKKKRKAAAGKKPDPEPPARRSALNITLSALPGLRRLRLSGIDASAARLGSALMGLTGLSSLRLMNCLLPTFFGSGGGGGEDEEDEEDGFGAAAAGGRGRGQEGRAGRGRRGRRGGGAAGASGSGSGSSSSSRRRGSGSKSASPFGLQLLQNLGSKLRDLSLHDCMLGSLPGEVLAGLPLLRLLDLSGNCFAVLPPSLNSLRLLEYLDLQGNQLVALPAGFGTGLRGRLADLDLGRNQLTSLPPDFSRLTGLTYLSLASNPELSWEDMVHPLAALTNLHSLCFDDLELEAEPHEPVDLFEVQGLGLVAPDAAAEPNAQQQPQPPQQAPQQAPQQPQGQPGPVQQRAPRPSPTPLEHLVAALTAPAHAAAGCRLRELSLNSIGTGELPAALSQLTALSYLSLNCNFIREEDDGGGAAAALAPLAGLSGSLAVLRLAYNDLAGQLPPLLWALTGLRELALEQNFIEELSPEVSRLTNLQVLNLDDAFSPETRRPRTAMPWRAVYELTRLRELKVTACDKAPALPAGIGSLYQLEVLVLNGFPVPAGVLEELAGSCGRLCGLQLRRAGIRELPPTFTRLERLLELDLEHNSLRSLPPGFGAGLSRLTELGLNYNPQLAALPADITALTRLSRLTWSVHKKSTHKPSRVQLAWMSGVRNLYLVGAWEHNALAKRYGVRTSAQGPAGGRRG
ncbi:hypothetical protein HYH02_013630 [Chlamydomonas schloesseri]|uniref:Uncharacterized protein n=1 Tax=Chlamydomonas schloesseri TaxID=2026947 RepID=A0A835T397_9CHLO|nr:hypothetical protein HYH02_013630 [Chlamydomonas schloesseri]|eukprot:KAG2430791.1 hypothetical protein HYH02_013630 [Chlamydomonas schloesseri]